MSHGTPWLRPLLPALLLALGPCGGAALAADAKTYTFGPSSEIDYYLVHHLHHVTGVTHSLHGKVTLDGDHLRVPLLLTLDLVSFNSGNENRDNNAAFTLGVDRFPKAKLDVQKFTETSHARDAAGLHLEGTAIGRLALHGLSHAIAIPLKGLVTAGVLTVDGEFTVKLTDYGITRPALLGMPVSDDVRVTVHGVAAP